MHSSWRLIGGLVCSFTCFCALTALGAPPATDLSAPPILASQFYQTLQFPAGREEVVAVLYGHPKYGFYRTQAFQKVDGRIELTLLPPGYRHTIEFWAERRDQSFRRLGATRFRSPLPLLLKKAEGVNLRGGFTFNFLAYNNELDVSGSVPLKFPVIANRQGEIVWAHFIHGGQPFIAQDLHVQPLAPGVMGVMTTLGDSYFETVTMRGAVRYSFYASRLSPPARVFHHDFLPVTDRRILFLDYAKGFYVGFAWPPVWETYTDIVSEVDVETKSRKVLWNSAVLGPFRFPRFMRLGFAAKILSKLCASSRLCGHWRADEELHANSLLKLPDERGFLISLRGTSELIETGRDFAGPYRAWTTAGGGPVTIQVPNSSVRMSHQHRPVFSPRGTILVFNNNPGEASSNILEISIESPPRVERVYIPSVPIDAAYRSSVGSTPSGNVLAYFSIANTKNSSRKADIVVEFDHVSAQEVARMELPVLHAGPKWSTHMGVPMATLDGEEFLGNVPAFSGERSKYSGEKRH